MFFSRIAQAVSNNRLFRRLALELRDAKQRTAFRRFRDLNAYEKRILSQNGEDGIISELFSRIPHERRFVEIGVEDGAQCNTALLARHYGWTGVMIEADAQMFERLQTAFASFPVTCLNLFVSRENIAAALNAAGVPSRFDLLSIDIDGNDYYVWEALEEYEPSVVILEYNASFGPRASKTIAYNPAHTWRKDRYYGASLTALQRLGKRLGYALIGTDRRGVNSFFVRKDLLGLCGFPERDAADAWRQNPLISLLPQGSGALIEP
jgi:hypothetical protein